MSSFVMSIRKIIRNGTSTATILNMSCNRIRGDPCTEHHISFAKSSSGHPCTRHANLMPTLRMERSWALSQPPTDLPEAKVWNMRLPPH